MRLFAVIVVAVMLGSLGAAARRADSHTLNSQPIGLRVIHAVDHARRAAQGCRQRLEGRTWPVEYLERRTSNVALRQWVLRRWTARAKVKCAAVRRMLAWQNSAKARNIAAAVDVFVEGHRRQGDPWPNCPDPFDGTGSWDDTKDCESPGYAWHEDPPGYYCGPLQIDPKLWAVYLRRHGLSC